MALSLDAFTDASRPRQRGCKIATILASLDAADRDVVSAALFDPTITDAAIESVLKANDHPISHQTVARHRTGNCAC